LLIEAKALGLSEQASYEQRNDFGTRGLSGDLDDKIEVLIEFRMEDGSDSRWDEGAILEQTWSRSEIDNLLNVSIDKAETVEVTWFQPDYWTRVDTFDAALFSADCEKVDNFVSDIQMQ
jgi:hypothetical protein